MIDKANTWLADAGNTIKNSAYPQTLLWQMIAIAFVYGFLELVKTLKQNKEK